MPKLVPLNPDDVKFPIHFGCDENLDWLVFRENGEPYVVFFSNPQTAREFLKSRFPESSVQILAVRSALELHANLLDLSWQGVEKWWVC